MPIQEFLTKKSIGVLMHPSCIPGGNVSGTFGKGAKKWIKKRHKHGIEYAFTSYTYRLYWVAIWLPSILHLTHGFLT